MQNIPHAIRSVAYEKQEDIDPYICCAAGVLSVWLREKRTRRGRRTAGHRGTGEIAPPL